MATRRRAVKAIGEDATAWGVAAGRRMAAYILDTLTDWPGDLPPSLRVTVGRAAVGIDGFRTTHEQAVAARRMARLGATERPARSGHTSARPS
ncbi:hypothetical protein ACIHCX_35765 [Streptomyces sp. NPDC052043]|uniref:hypothetical protein n=1 Tax=Streptomyces sp. NPDC052043 TaxID=3365684 RepID=UPI0037D81DD8